MTDPGTSAGRWSRAERGLAAALRWGGMVSFVVLLVLVTAEILIRFLPLFFLGWADEIVELAFAWMVFLGTAALWRGNEHITIDFIPQALAGSTAGRVLEILVGLLALGFLAVFTWEGWLLTLQAVGNRTPILELPKPAWYVALPISGVVMIGYTLGRCVRAIRPAGARQSPAKTS
jgi:TRAP-type C4-dicarboxylate transport system permease small subunit